MSVQRGKPPKEERRRWLIEVAFQRAPSLCLQNSLQGVGREDPSGISDLLIERHKEFKRSRFG